MPSPRRSQNRPPTYSRSSARQSQACPRRSDPAQRPLAHPENSPRHVPRAVDPDGSMRVTFPAHDPRCVCRISNASANHHVLGLRLLYLYAPSAPRRYSLWLSSSPCATRCPTSTSHFCSTLRFPPSPSRLYLVFSLVDRPHEAARSAFAETQLGVRDSPAPSMPLVDRVPVRQILAALFEIFPSIPRSAPL